MKLLPTQDETHTKLILNNVNPVCFLAPNVKTNAGECNLIPTSAHMTVARVDRVLNECLVCCNLCSCFFFKQSYCRQAGFGGFFMFHLREGCAAAVNTLLCACRGCVLAVGMWISRRQCLEVRNFTVYCFPFMEKQGLTC